jgi:hypothetical protein
MGDVICHSSKTYVWMGTVCQEIDQILPSDFCVYEPYPKDYWCDLNSNYVWIRFDEEIQNEFFSNLLSVGKDWITTVRLGRQPRNVVIFNPKKRTERELKERIQIISFNGKLLCLRRLHGSPSERLSEYETPGTVYVVI